MLGSRQQRHHRKTTESLGVYIIISPDEGTHLKRKYYIVRCHLNFSQVSNDISPPPKEVNNESKNKSYKRIKDIFPWEISCGYPNTNLKLIFVTLKH